MTANEWFPDINSMPHDEYGQPYPDPAVAPGLHRVRRFTPIDDPTAFTSNLAYSGYTDRDNDRPLLGGSTMTQYYFGLLGRWLRGLQSILSYANAKVQGVMGADFNQPPAPGQQLTPVYGDRSLNPAYSWIFRATIDGKTMTIDNRYGESHPGYSDPHDLPALLDSVPQPGEDPIQVYGGYNILSYGGMEFRCGGVKAYLFHLESMTADTTVVTLSNPLPRGTWDVAGWADVGHPETWLDVQPGRPLISTTTNTGWVDLTGAEPTYELLSIIGAPCLIATPRRAQQGGYDATIRLLGSTSDTMPSGTSDAMDLTEWALTGTHVYSESPGGKSTAHSTYLDLAALRIAYPELKWFWMDYCPEVNTAVLSDATHLIRSAEGCANNRCDVSHNIGHVQDISWIAVHPNGSHWYCAAHTFPGVLLSQYNARCNNTKCPNWSPHNNTGGTRLSQYDLSRLIMAHNYSLKDRTPPGYPDKQYTLQRGEGPGLCWLAGQPTLDDQGLYVQHVVAFSYLFGYTEPDPDHPSILRIHYGAKDVFNRGATDPNPSDPYGNGVDYASSSDRLEIERLVPGTRNPGVIDHDPTSSAEGPGEAGVQRVFSRKVTFRDIDMSDAKLGQPQFDLAGPALPPHVITHYKTESYDIVQIQLTREYKTTSKAHIPDSARFVHTAELDAGTHTAKVYMVPGISEAEYKLTAEEDATVRFLTGGLTVDPPDQKKVRNVATPMYHSGYGWLDKAAKGDTCTIDLIGPYAPMLPDELKTIRIPILWAQSFFGSAYNGGANGGVSPSIAPSGPGLPVGYETFRLKRDMIVLDFSGGAGLQVWNWLQQMLALAGGVPAFMLKLNFGTEGVMPPRQKVNAAYPPVIADAGHAPTLTHVTRTGEADPGSSQGLATITEFDPTMGLIKVNSTGWDTSLKHDIRAEFQVLEFDRNVSHQFFRSTLNAVKRMEACGMGWGGTGLYLSLMFGSHSIPNGSVNADLYLPGTPVSSPSQLVYHPDADTSVQKWVVLPDMPSSCYVGYADPKTTGYFFLAMATLQAMSVPSLPSWDTDEYTQVLIPIRFHNGSISEAEYWLGGDYGGGVWTSQPLSNNVPLQIGIYAMDIADGVATNIVHYGSVSFMVNKEGDDFVGMADFTAICKALGANPPEPGKTLWLVTSAGGLDPTEPGLQGLRSYIKEVRTNGPNYSLYSKVQMLSYDSVSLSGGGIIRVSWDGIIANAPEKFMGNPGTLENPT